MSDLLCMDESVKPSICPLAVECEFGVERIDGMGGIGSTRRVTFISSTTAAVGGEQVIVASPTHRRSTDTFERYCKWLGKAEPLSDLYGVNKANRTVRFDGGGSVQFVTLSEDMKGRRPESVLLDDMEGHE